MQDGVNWTIEDTTGKGGGLNWGQVKPTVYDVGNPRVTGRTVVRRVYNDNRTIQVALMWLGNSSGTTYAQWNTILHNLVQTLEGITASQPAALQFQPTGSSTTLYFDVLEAHLLMSYQELLFAQQIGDEVVLELVCKPFLRGARQTLSNAVTNPGFEAPSGPGVQVFNDPLSNLNAYVPQQYQAAVAADAPLRYYRMQEVTGTTAIDSGSALINGTYTGGVTLGVAGICGGASFAATFNGTSGYISVPTTGLPSANHAWTQECWVNFASIPLAVKNILTLGTFATGQGTDLQIQTNGKITIQFVGGSAITGGVALTTSAWHHLVVTWDGTTLTLYQDGASQGTLTPGAANITYGVFNVAGDFGVPATFLPATLDEVALYTTALSSGRVSAHYNAGPPAIALAQDTYQFPDAITALQGAAGASSTTLAVLRYYRLDETSGTTCFDASGNAQNGTTHASPTQGVAGLLTGDTDTCYTFTKASSQYVSCPVSGLPTGNAAFSFGCLFKFAANPASSAVLISYIGAGAHNGIEVFIDTSGKLNAITNSGAGTCQTAAVTTGVAHLMVLTWDGTTMSLYLDNAAAVTATPGSETVSSPSLNIGSDGSNFWNGQIDEPWFASGCLTSAQVTSLYNAFHTTPAATANTMAIPAGGRVSFGSPAWGAINTWQVRFRWLTGSAPTFYLHYTDANNNLQAAVTGTALTLNQVVGGVTQQVGTQALQLVNGVQYWLKVTQFPTGPGTPYMQAQLFFDTGGAVGSSIAAAAAGYTFDAVTALIGKPQIAAAGTALGIGGNFTTGVHALSLFGPGGWTVTGLQNAVTGVVSGAWDGSHADFGMSGTGSANTYPNGPVISTGVARLDLPPGGTVDALWRLYTGGTAITSSAIPIQTATNVVGYSLQVKETGLASGATIAVVITEYNTSGNATGSASGNLGALSAGTLPTSWTTISGTYSTHANCAYIDVALRVVDTGVAAESAGATVWTDNWVVWDQTRTGMTTMPYCELRAPKTPAQLMVSGILGDVEAPTHLSIGILTGAGSISSASFLLGRRKAASTGCQLVFPPLSNANSNGSSGVFALDNTDPSGVIITTNINATNMGTTYAQNLLTLDHQGVYHLYARGYTPDANAATTVSLQSLYQDVSAFNGSFAFPTYLGGVSGPVVNPCQRGAGTYVMDAGQVTLPLYTRTPLADPSLSATWVAIWYFKDTNSNIRKLGTGLLLPTDGELIIGQYVSPAMASGFGWVFTYVDAISTTYGLSEESWAVPHPAGAIGGLAVGNFANNDYVVLNADCGAHLNPNATSGYPSHTARGVNQWGMVASDNTGLAMACIMETAYSPLYLYPH